MASFGGSLNPETSKIFRVRKTCLKMLAKRGYLVGEDHLNMTTEEFRSKYGESPSRESLTILVEKENDPTDQLFVFFAEDEKVGVKPIKTYCERMKEENVTKAIMVVRGGITPFAKQALQEMAHRYKIEHFKDNELIVDITEHQLVPEHVVMTNDEKKELLKRYKLKETQLPRIQVSDPVARYFGLARGQVVEITRPSETAGRYVTYRLCL
ncbi:unnamed protein product [Heterosigma akashiwo]|mmetsp:Transcript_56881/g.83244  ORF Transcript_56881/g.83244 Transcript_56881/m.83244 type:complete len:211 (-) Transcript_56881:59-691(-)|eukprot:CAMPEP_0206402516 /NCGR_PEP_ID=MMETSP0294-20121207/27035_1 /ASSEMBLY_ACC=CAM_ASM_000327 /TAXON_ID=39354 /ORGANISM="Heterosigma akashiwo, Strain CCMP2393" /LENGTH=210 /DNA_ID=CAMNT_0053859669 /DNA_START=136 /DNA_END=768 /DNA_ORIENTATION=+